VRRNPGDPVRRLPNVNRRILLLASVTIVVLAVLAIGRWATSTAPSATLAQPPAAAVEANSADNLFRVRIRAEPATYRSGEPIHVQAWLAYLGPKDRETIVGSGSGLVGFSWEQLDGQRRQGGAATADCRPYSIERAIPIAVRFTKSGGFTAEDPDAPYWRQYFADPVFRLLPGHYRIHAQADFTVGACGGERHDLEASVQVLVVP